MRKLKNCIASLLILASLYSCVHTQVPKGPDCRILHGTIFCIDTRISEEDLEREREYDIMFEDAVGYRCIPNDYYGRLETFFLDVMEENEILRRESNGNNTY